MTGVEAVILTSAFQQFVTGFAQSFSDSPRSQAAKQLRVKMQRNEPAFQKALGITRPKLGRTQSMLGNYDPAIKAYDIALYAWTLGWRPTPAVLQGQSESRVTLSGMSPVAFGNFIPFTPTGGNPAWRSLGHQAVLSGQFLTQ